MRQRWRGLESSSAKWILVRVCASAKLTAHASQTRSLSLWVPVCERQQMPGTVCIRLPAGGFLHANRTKTLSLLELIYDGFLAPQESRK